MANFALQVPHALLLEDEPIISMDMATVFEAEGFDVSSAMSCAEAASWLHGHRPDVVIVDIELRDGVCTEVVARLIEANIPFVVYSGDQKSFHAGTPFAQALWVSKPALPGELMDAVKAALALGGSSLLV